jgi:cobalt-zinc-cadmium efflux system membrane fusion protein
MAGIVLGTIGFAPGCSRRPDIATTAEANESKPQDPQRIVLPENSPKLQQIRVDTVRTQEIALDDVAAPAKIEVNPNRVSRVMLPVTGRVLNTLVRIGDSVSQGRPVLVLESSDADSALAADLQSEAALAQANAAYVKAKADYERLGDLFAQEAVAKKDVLAAEAALAQTKAAVDQAEAARRQTKARLDILGLKSNQPRQKIEVLAPISGKVLEMSTVAGEYRNDTSTPVMTIADLSSVWISADVPENQIRLVRMGERLQVELTAYPGRTFQATVTRIADVVDANTRTVKVYAELNNSRAELKAEMFGRVRYVKQVRRLVVVPPGAVLEGAGESYVFRELSPGTFAPTPVVVSGRGKDCVGVLRGLDPGARVVVDGAMLLKAN